METRIKKYLKIGLTNFMRPWDVANSMAGTMASLKRALRQRRNQRNLISELRSESKEYKRFIETIAFEFNGSTINNSDRNCSV